MYWLRREEVRKFSAIGPSTKTDSVPGTLPPSPVWGTSGVMSTIQLCKFIFLVRVRGTLAELLFCIRLVLSPDMLSGSPVQEVKEVSLRSRFNLCAYCTNADYSQRLDGPSMASA